MSTRCTKEFSISVSDPEPQCPISPTSIPDGQQVVLYSVQFTQTLFVGAEYWYIGLSGGDSPFGIGFEDTSNGILIGEIGGAPGVYTFDICVSPAATPQENGCCRQFTMTVAPPAPTTYYSAEIRASAFPDCFSLLMTAVDGTMAGQTCVTTGVSAGAFSSLISQEDADNQALAQFGLQNTPGCGDFETDVILAGGYVTFSCA